MNKRALPYLDGQYKKMIKKIHLNFINSFNCKTDNYQNETYIASIIREDAIDDYFIYINKHKIDYYIQSSKFETNHILYEKMLV